MQTQSRLETDREYQAALNTAGVIDQSLRGLIELTGDDRVDFLQRMTTNDMRLLDSRAYVQTVLTTPEAKVVDLLDVYVRPNLLLSVTSPGNSVKVLQWFRAQIFFRDKVKVADVATKYGYLSLLGPNAQAILSEAGADTTGLVPSQAREFTIDECQVLVVALGHKMGQIYQIFLTGDGALRFRESLMAHGRGYGMMEIHSAAQEMLRIESGTPAFGSELGEEVNALEAGLRDAISFSKGCYTGQEVIARLDTYQKLKQTVVGVSLSVMPVSKLPLEICALDQSVGKLTSIAAFPDGRVLGLGYVRTKYVASKSAYEVVDGERRIAAHVWLLSEEGNVR